MKSFLIKPRIPMLFLFMALLLIQGCSQPASVQTEQEHATDQHHQIGMTHTHPPNKAILWNVQPLPEQLSTNTPATLVWELKDPKTQLPIRNFEKTHDKLAHFIVVSEDLNSFQHLHPDIIGPGKMSVSVAFPQTGKYTLFLQVSTPEQGEQTLRTQLAIGKGSSPKVSLMPDSDKPKQLNGRTFQLQNLPTIAGKAAMFNLVIEKNGKPVKGIQPYLGAGGHVVVLSQDSEHFLHVHPMTKSVNGLYNSPIAFHTEIEEPGLYKLWGQVLLDNTVVTVPFVFEVKAQK